MKFIRDIIAEKKSEAAASEDPAPTIAMGNMSDEGHSQSFDLDEVAEDDHAPEAFTLDSDMRVTDEAELDDLEDLAGEDTDEDDDGFSLFAENDDQEEDVADLTDRDEELYSAEEDETPMTDDLYADDSSNEDQMEPADAAPSAPVMPTRVRPTRRTDRQSASEAEEAGFAQDDATVEDPQEHRISLDGLHALRSDRQPGEEGASGHDPLQALRLDLDAVPDHPASGDAPQSVEMPTPAAGRASRRAGRVKTRLLGFSSAQAGAADPFAATPAANEQNPAKVMFPVGWLVVETGHGRGAAFTLFNGVTQIGRGEGQDVRLDFGDNSISREGHAAIAFDAEQKAFYLGHGGKANLVRRNDRPVLSTEELTSGDRIRVGETTLRFVGLCGPDFDWSDAQGDEMGNVSFG